jgi:PadR family transcriptional regulator PadR
VKELNGIKPREVQAKLMRGLLDLVVLQLLRTHPMHGYQIITSIRKSFGVYFGPSTIYPLLNLLEEKGYVKSGWDMDHERPRKVYELTKEGQSTLDFTEDSLELICRKIGTNIQFNIDSETEEINQIERHLRNKTNLVPTLAK